MMHTVFCPANIYFGTCRKKHGTKAVRANTSISIINCNTLCENGLMQNHSFPGKFGIIIAHYIKIAGIAVTCQNHCSLVSSKSIIRAGYPASISGGG